MTEKEFGEFSALLLRDPRGRDNKRLAMMRVRLGDIFELANAMECISDGAKGNFMKAVDDLTKFSYQIEG